MIVGWLITLKVSWLITPLCIWRISTSSITTVSHNTLCSTLNTSTATAGSYRTGRCAGISAH
jgi:hypothetical protein